MNKVIRDGKVAIIYAPGFGAGWVTWHGVEALMYDPIVVDMVERDLKSETIVEYCNKTYGEEYYWGGADQLGLVWLDEGTEFYIDEYDGSESVVLRDSMTWFKA